MSTSYHVASPCCSGLWLTMRVVQAKDCLPSRVRPFLQAPRRLLYPVVFVDLWCLAELSLPVPFSSQEPSKSCFREVAFDGWVAKLLEGLCARWAGLSLARGTPLPLPPRRYLISRSSTFSSSVISPLLLSLFHANECFPTPVPDTGTSLSLSPNAFCLSSTTHTLIQAPFSFECRVIFAFAPSRSLKMSSFFVLALFQEGSREFPHRWHSTK